MPMKNICRVFKYPAKHVHAIVLNVNSYSEFVPWCLSSRIVKHVDSSRFFAEMEIGFGDFKEKYLSKVEATDEIISAEAVNSDLFDYLQTRWRISPISENKAHVDFNINFRFRSQLYDKLTHAVFSNQSENIVDSFDKRCKCLWSP